MYSKVIILAVMGIVVVAQGAQADDKLMNLYPQSRAKHLEKTDYNAAKYKSRGQEYVDHMYETGSETPMPDSIDDDLESASDTVPVDVNAVANIVKDNAAPSDKAPTAKP